MNEPNNTSNENIENLKIKVLFDNYDFRSDLGQGWGYAAVLQGPEKTILFETPAQTAKL